MTLQNPLMRVLLLNETYSALICKRVYHKKRFNMTSRFSVFQIILIICLLRPGISGYNSDHFSESAVNDSLKHEMVLVEGAVFYPALLSDTIPNKQECKVILSDFYIGKYEVTQELWISVMGKNPSDIKNLPFLPVETISWYEAIEFCNRLSLAEGLKPCYSIDSTKRDTNNLALWDALKLSVIFDPEANGYRLPTEAEWEYAARGGNKSKNYKYAGSDNPGEVAWYRENSGDRTKPVGLKKPNELGLYDISGNVWEWCWDWESALPSGEFKNPVGSLQGNKRVGRGGAYFLEEEYLSTTERSGFYAMWSSNIMGLRLARNK